MYGESDAEIAQKVDGVTSPRDLYERIKEDGHPICSKCGAMYVDDAHCGPLSDPSENVGTPEMPRQPQPSKEAGRELPALSNATALFRDTVNTLADYIERLQYHKVVLRDGHFVATDEIPKEAEIYPIMYIRDEHTAERWEEICAEHDEDPKSTSVVYVYQDASWAKGATHFPPWLETCLFTTVLMQSPGAVERLLNEVNLEPAEAPREQIRDLLLGRPGKSEGLYRTAAKLARVIRGAEVGQGRPRSPVNSWQQAMVQAIKEGRERGLTDERIRQTLEVDEEEFARLEKLL
jgi:hypothetical protein